MWKQVAVVVAVALLAGGAAASGAGKKAPPVNSQLPNIAGTPRQGEVLFAATGFWTGATPISYSYRWRRCDPAGNGCSNINGAKNTTYRLVHEDAGRRIRVAVTAKNHDGSATAVSGPTDVVAEAFKPQNSAAPTIAGTAKDGQTLTASPGTWANTPVSFEYQWRRCDSNGAACSDVGDAKQTYVLGPRDVGSTIRVRVKAKNAIGADSALSAPTGVVAPRGPVATNASPPTIAGTAQAGQVLTASPGSWANAPTSYTYRWLRCDVNGNNCTSQIGTGPSQRLASADVGHRVRVAVTALNQFGPSAPAQSAPSAVVAPGGPAGAITLPDGRVSLPVQSVVPPQKLVISNVLFVPSRLHGRSAFVGRFRITDTRGYVIRDALVYAIALPYGWIRPAPETVTGTDGWATIQFIPTAQMPVRRAAVVFFVRARKPGDSLLTGVAARRLVQVGIG